MLRDFNPWIFIIAISATVASFAQVLLKMSAGKRHKNWIFEYLNPYVIGGYGLMFVGMFLNIFAYSRGVQYKNGPIMESTGNIWVVVLSALFFKEAITKNKVLGNVLIFLGIAIFYIGWSDISPALAFLERDILSFFG